MEGHTDFSQEDLEVLPAEILLRRVTDFFKRVAARNTWLGIHTSEGKVVIARLEVVLLLL